MYMRDSLDFSTLDSVLKKTIEAVETSKVQVFDIAENARHECYSTRSELERLKREVAATIHETDELDREFRISRQRLVEVSRDFTRYTEKDIKEAYEKSSEMQVALSVSREKEMNLRKRRDDLERRMRNLTTTVDKADQMMTQIGVVLGYLNGDLGNIVNAVESAQQRQQLGLQVIQAQEEERKRVARDIHDGPAQSMANVVIRTEIAQRILEQGKVDEAKQELRELRETVKNTLGEVRKIIFDLRPMALDDLGLIPTLRKYLDNFKQRYPIQTELVTSGPERRLDTAKEVVIFRMVQEALNNVVKHSQAENVKITLSFGTDQVQVEVKDDGVGFEHKAQTDRPQFGIMGMRERMKLINGRLNLESASGKGTRVIFTIPHKTEEGKNL